MKVIAIKAGYHIGPRKVNETFDMDESAMKKDKGGKALLPSWVVPAEAPKEAKGKAPTKPADSDLA